MTCASTHDAAQSETSTEGLVPVRRVVHAEPVQLSPRAELVAASAVRPLFVVQGYVTRWALPALTALITVHLYETIGLWAFLGLLALLMASFRSLGTEFEAEANCGEHPTRTYA